MNGQDALTVTGVTKSFGGVHAVREVSFNVRAGSLTALIGPNGAGKSTMFNLLTNLYIADSGTIAYFDQDLAGLRSDKIARLGLIRTFQTARVFAGMSVLENVLAGAHIGTHSTVWEEALRLPRATSEERTVREKASRLIDVLGLGPVAEDPAISLPLGLQKLLEIARALMAGPRVLLLDEPAAGLNDTETLRLAELLVAINAAGVTMVVVEHNMSLVMSISQDIVVLDAGRVIARGTPAAVQADERVIEAYVGRATDAVAGLMADMLDIRDLSAGYGAALVLHGVTLRVGQGELVALVGANGAGKTTLLKTISGLIVPRSGTAELAGKPLSALTSVARVQLGLAHVPEGRQIFGDLSVAENLEIGAYTQLGSVSKDEYTARAAEVYRIFPILLEKKELPAGGLSGGQQQMLAIGRGLMLKPQLLLLDEPSLGLSPLLVTEIFRVLATLRETGVSILLSEQNARLSLAIADRGYVIETGKIVREGTGSELLASSDIMERYLGVGTSSIDLENDPAKDELARKLRGIVGTAAV